jgi:hypothetical protein
MFLIVIKKSKIQFKQILGKDFRLTAYRTSLNLRRLGFAYAGWKNPVDLINHNSVSYIIDTSKYISVEVVLVNMLECQMYIFDPKPKSKSILSVLY